MSTAETCQFENGVEGRYQECAAGERKDRISLVWKMEYVESGHHLGASANERRAQQSALASLSLPSMKVTVRNQALSGLKRETGVSRNAMLIHFVDSVVFLQKPKW
jgi:hypothetical protein